MTLNLDLSNALKIIQNAGLDDPRLGIADPALQLQSIIDALCHLSTHDGLTGLVNAGFFHTILSKEVDRSLRTGRGCGLMVIDINDFKRINDTFGHLAGDKSLQTVAAQMKRSLRAMDTAGRIGGDEFAVILPECAPEDAVHTAKRIHSSLNLLKVDFTTDLCITISSGLAWITADKSLSSTDLLAEADREMYRSKNSGSGILCYKSLTAV